MVGIAAGQCGRARASGEVAARGCQCNGRADRCAVLALPSTPDVGAVADVPLQELSVADGAETDPHRSLPQSILKRWIGWLARRLAGRFRLGRPYAVKIAAASFRHRQSYMLRISRFTPPVHHVASLGCLRQSSTRLMRAVRVRLQGPILSSLNQRVPAPHHASRTGLHQRHSQANPSPDTRRSSRRWETRSAARAIRHADRKHRRQLHLYLKGKIEYGAVIDEQKPIVDACKIAGQFPRRRSKGKVQCRKAPSQG